MSGKKKYIIAIVLFIFIGLMIFTFANPLDDDDTKRLDNGTQSDIEDDDSGSEDDGQDDEIITDDEDDNATDNVINPVPLVDNSYELALQAVINAETKLDEESYNAALDLINKVTDNRKEELADRLEEVKNSIDVIALVEQLESKVNTSADKDDMDDARDFRADEKIIEKVEALQNANVKSDLQATLDELAKLLNDENEPVINIEDGAILSSKTKIEVEDENEVTITVQNDGSTDSIEIPNGYEVEEGKYSLTVVDAAFNEVTITFTVDYSDPAFNIASGTHSDSDINVVISDLSFDYVEIYNQDENTKVLETKDEFVLTSEATYRLTAYDKLGNETVIWVAIDKEDPTIDATGTGVGTYFRDDVTLTVFDKFLTEVKVNDDVYTTSDFTNEANNENRTFEKVYTEPGVYDVVAKDKFGHEAEYTFTIDKTIPSVNVKNGGYYKDPITLKITEEYLHKAELTLPNGEKVTVNSGYVIDGQGKYYLKVRDKAYNLLEISFIVDFEAPKFKPNQWNYTLEVDKDAEFTCPDMSDYVTDNLSGVASVVVDKWHSKPDQTKVGKFTCRYISTDKAGNRVSNDLHYTVVDTTKPELHPSYWRKTVEANKDAEFTDFPEVYGTDNANGEVKVELIGNTVDMSTPGDYYLRYRTTDANGNVATNKIFITVVDTTAPVYKDLGIYGGQTFNGKMYVTNGDKIYINVHFNEKLAINPIVKINGKEVFQYEDPVEKVDANGNTYYIYSKTYTVSEEDGLTDGELSFEIYGYEDEAGNVGTPLTALNTTIGAQNGQIIVDKTAPSLVVDEGDNPQVHANDILPFTVDVKINGVSQRVDSTTTDPQDEYGTWFGIWYLPDGDYEVIATDLIGNTKTVTFKQDRLVITESAVGANYIDENKDGGTINNFNSFAIKFNRDLTFTYGSATEGFKIEMYYSTDNGVTYQKDEKTVINNWWDNTLCNSTTTKYPNSDSTFTISANSPIYWSGQKVSSRYPEIYQAILDTKDTENKVYVKTVFTVIQPTYTKVFELDPVIYSKGGTEVTPLGLADFQ